MKRSATFVVCLATTATLLAIGPSLFAQTSSSPVAYVYVSNNPNGVGAINGYSVDSTGRLTPIIGSPFPASVSWMAVNGAWLFGTENYTYIDSFSIAPNGALQQVSQINASRYNVYATGGPANVFLDHTGATLYDGDTYAYGTGDNAYEAFSIDQSTGQLNFLQLGPNGGEVQGEVMSFTGSNKYAYSSFCYEGDPAIFGYQRNSDGTLTSLNINPTIPPAPNGNYYCPYLAAADPHNHVAIALTPFNFLTQEGAPQLAVYTQQSNGNLTTTSTSANMPKTVVGSVNDLWMAPSGKLLAVAGTSGLQVFHFNGANPITRYTGLLTKDEIDQAFWDNNNHLYAISRTTGKLYVFTVTPTSHSQAAGSPYTISSPENLIVLPK
jgi:6-phosphogluconolactonase (cycloisomerase 2 family)